MAPSATAPPVCAAAECALGCVTECASAADGPPVTRDTPVEVFDVAFQALDGSILLEGLPSTDGGFGEWLGAVGRLIEGLQGGSRKAMLDGAARRMRALTGFDHVTLVRAHGDEHCLLPLVVALLVAHVLYNRALGLFGA